MSKVAESKLCNAWLNPGIIFQWESTFKAMSYLGKDCHSSVTLYRDHLIARNPEMWGITKAGGEQSSGGDSGPSPCGIWEFSMYPADWTASITHALHLRPRQPWVNFHWTLRQKASDCLWKQRSLSGLNRKMPIKIKILQKWNEEWSS